MEERLKAIKVKAFGFLIEGRWLKEQEIIVYWAGTRTKALSSKEIQGPRCEQCRNYNEETFKILMKHKRDLQHIKNLKTRFMKLYLKWGK